YSLFVNGSSLCKADQVFHFVLHLKLQFTEMRGSLYQFIPDRSFLLIGEPDFLFVLHHQLGRKHVLRKRIWMRLRCWLRNIRLRDVRLRCLRPNRRKRSRSWLLRKSDLRLCGKRRRRRSLRRLLGHYGRGGLLRKREPCTKQYQCK